MGMTMNVFIAVLAMTLIGGGPGQVMAADQDPGECLLSPDGNSSTAG